MSEVDLSPTGEILLGCMDELTDLQARHTALVEACNILNTELGRFGEPDMYAVTDEAVTSWRKGLAAAQEETT